MADVKLASKVAADAMQAQGARLRVIAQNIANANSTGDTEQTQPYRRQVVTFKTVFDRAMGGDTVEIGRIMGDPTEFDRRFQPGHPSADADGYVLFPNVNPLIEMMDMREAQRSYDANLNIIDTARGMMRRTVEMLRS